MSEKTADASVPAVESLLFWVDANEQDAGETALDGARALFSRDGGSILRSVPLGPLRRNLADTVDALQQVFADIAERGGTLPLAEAQLWFQVTSSGSIQLIGSGQVQAARGLTLTFRRPGDERTESGSGGRLGHGRWQGDQSRTGS
ncbi:Pepco domain-containing protein [Streptomyces katsurahamanus]|uniref:Pepco domain-containing protein n=1 Tax=Streptomyces katsurahamanus TaxID=2577098 RepID=A0ABW9P2Z7_9ACTN|nr:hypothetical protein [Streptomyces katsurahamanus]MQS39794.1 hypothetical protein [Streptomyces katsurahamanus]